jgi:membrane protease YdiL (CAAX protease family)
MTQFIDLPKRGRNEWWRYALSLGLIVTFTLAVAIIAVEVLPLLGAQSRTAGAGIVTEPILSFIELGGFDFSLIIGILLAVRLIHKRPFLTMITPDRWIDWKKVGKSFGLFFALVAITTLLDYLLNPSTYLLSFNPQRFLIFAPLAVVLVPIQTSAEELLFRGYLLQSMALLTRNRAVLVLISGVLFMLPHLANPEMTAGFWSMASYYFLVGVVLTIITLRSNSLEMAMGIHAAINLFAALIVNYANSALETESIFYCTEIEPIFTVLSFVIMALVFYLLMFRGSSNTEIVEPIEKDEDQFHC